MNITIERKGENIVTSTKLEKINVLKKERERLAQEIHKTKNREEKERLSRRDYKAHEFVRRIIKTDEFGQEANDLFEEVLFFLSSEE